MYQGSMVALVTPMKAGGAVDEQSMAKLIEWHIENKTDAIVAVGTTGESATLGHEEHCGVVAMVVEMVAGRIPVIAGSGANSTSEALLQTRCAKGAGADACLLVTPYYNKPPQEGLYQHYKTIAESVDIPQILYNVPARTACDMLPETVARLSKVSNIIGIKEATSSVERAQEIRDRCNGDFEVYSGEDISTLSLMLEAGARGCISVTANLAPRAMHEMCSAALSGDAKTAAEINERLVGLHKDLFLESNPMPAKWALAEMGMIEAGIRLPLIPFSEQYHEKLRKSMKQAGN